MSDVTVTNTPASQVTTQIQAATSETVDGVIVGDLSTSKVGFFGTVPVTKTTVTLAATSGTTVAASVAADLYTLKAALSALGLV